MALRKRGRWLYAYYDQWERDGLALKRRRVEKCLYTEDRDVAKLLERKLMTDAKEESVQARAGAKIDAILTGGTVSVRRAAPRRMRIADAVSRAERYRTVGETARKLWKRFVRECGCVYMDEVTPHRALAYLEKIAPNGGKVFNNTRSALNGIFKLLLIDANLNASPFELVRPARVSSLSQRPFTGEEYARILKAARSPWKEAVQIAWWTGLREKDVFTLKWSEIHGDLIRRLPAKTARFRREVLIPVHPTLAALLNGLKKKSSPDGRVLGHWPYRPKTATFSTGFREILEKAGIPQITPAGRANFNSFRNSFISRCDAAGIPRHAIRGIVGHVSDTQTDLYSHDETSARLIQSLPE